MANTTSVLGDQDLVLQPVRYRWREDTGVTIEEPFAGTADKVKARFYELAAAGGVASGADELVATLHDASGELSIVRLDDTRQLQEGVTGILGVTWELVPLTQSEPIETNRAFNGLTYDQKHAVQVAAGEPVETAYAGTDLQKKLYAYLVHHIEEYQTTSLVLRKTATVTGRTTLTASYADMNRVVTLASINPPAALIGALTSLPRDDGTTGAWEWLKLAPSVRSITRAKFQIVQEYHGASKWADIYGGSFNPQSPGS